jgi:hypothetical protein
MPKRETGPNGFQHHVIARLKETFPGCFVMKNDSSYIPGCPDLSIFVGNKWATLECKRGAHEHHQPNQDYYVNLHNKSGFSSFIYPENEEEVFSKLCLYFNTH